MGWRWFPRHGGGKLGEPPDYYREGIRLANEAKYHEMNVRYQEQAMDP